MVTPEKPIFLNKSEGEGEEADEDGSPGLRASWSYHKPRKQTIPPGLAAGWLRPLGGLANLILTVKIGCYSMEGEHYESVFHWAIDPFSYPPGQRIEHATQNANIPSGRTSGGMYLFLADSQVNARTLGSASPSRIRASQTIERPRKGRSRR